MDNLSGFLKVVERIYDIDLKVKEQEIPPYRIMPHSNHKEEISLEKSRLHEGNKFSNEDKFIRFDEAQVKEAIKSVKGFFSFKAKSELSKLKEPMTNDEAFDLVNKHSKVMDEDSLRNFRYMVASSS